VPDIDIEDAPALRAACDAAGITCTLLVSPTSSPERIARITALCSGFVYALARVGITGERSDAPDVAPLIARIRAATTLPIAAGFGISTAAHVAAVTAHADGAIVGSALVKVMEAAARQGEPVSSAAGAFCTTLRAGLDA
jgi:tryptophan synthase alpha chain